MSDPTSLCAYCLSPMLSKQREDGRGHRKKQYCNNGCRQNAHRGLGFNLSSDVRLHLEKKGCAICGCTDQKLYRDHDHKTGVFRGMLCRHCNLILGYCDDDVLLLQKCINYLQQSEQNNVRQGTQS